MRRSHLTIRVLKHVTHRSLQHSRTSAAARIEARRVLAQLISGPPGFDADQVLTARLDLPAAKYPDRDRQSQFAAQALERIRALPGVESAGAVSDLPSISSCRMPRLSASRLLTQCALQAG